eukprot:sb/3471318/
MCIKSAASLTYSLSLSLYISLSHYLSLSLTPSPSLSLPNVHVTCLCPITAFSTVSNSLRQKNGMILIIHGNELLRRAVARGDEPVAAEVGGSDLKRVSEGDDKQLTFDFRTTLFGRNSNPTPGSQIINAHHDRSQSEPTKWYNTEVSRVPSFRSTLLIGVWCTFTLVPRKEMRQTLRMANRIRSLR